MSVAGKVVLVTGAARGSGREYVRGFLKEGAKVIATDRSWTPTGASSDDYEFLPEIKDNPNVLADVMDITIDSHIKRVYKAAMAKFGTIDVIINNAGTRARDLYPPTSGVTTIVETELGDWLKMFDTNVFGTLRVIKSFVQPMLEKRRGSIINIGSASVPNQIHPGTSREGPYQPAKAALTCMTLYLAAELKPYNIAVNILVGGGRTTGSDEQVAIRARLLGGPPPRRQRPETNVPPALFLADQDASGATGQFIRSLEWNQQHGLGGFETWGYEPDIEAARVAPPLQH